MRTFAFRRHASSRPLRLAFIALSIVAAATGCSNTREALAYGKEMQRRTVALAQEYFDANVRRDSAALDRITTDSLKAQLGQFIPDSAVHAYFRSARDTFHPGRMMLGPCGATLQFFYEQEGKRTEGLMKVSYEDGRLKVDEMLIDLVH